MSLRAINADESFVLITLESGKVELRSINGILIRNICLRDSVNVKFSGQDIAIELENGKLN